MLSSTKKLYDIGFAIHLLQPKSKRPLNLKWTTGPRATWKELEKQHRPGMNVGVRLGAASKITQEDPLTAETTIGYLVVIDCDVRDPNYEAEVHEALNKHFPGWKEFPRVLSGRGQGSMHLYALTEKPTKGRIIAKVAGKYEVVIMGEGRQVVLPPSIHPETGLTYKWLSPLDSLPFLDLQAVSETPEDADEVPFEVGADVTLESFNLSPSMLAAIRVGEGVEDKSASLLGASIALIRGGATDQQILNVLTDKAYYLGQTGYAHAHTSSRSRAANWVSKHTLRKARKLTDHSLDFIEEPDYTILSDEETAAQLQRLFPHSNWQATLDRTKTGVLKPSLTNTITILKNHVAPNIFIKDTFLNSITYGVDVPWGFKKTDHISDTSVMCLAAYLGEHFKIEPYLSVLYTAAGAIANRNQKHCLREEVSLVEWDNKPRVDNWLQTYVKAHAEDPQYLKAVSRKVLCAMIARIYNPGVKFDHILVLEGPNQGEGKSRVIRALAGPQWYGSVRFDMDHKDFVLTLQGKWVCEISELSGLNRRDSSFVKALITEQEDRIRQPYGRAIETMPRQSIFIGTTNHFQYLEDETGNRRYWPVRVGTEIDVEGLARDRAQLLAEAKVLYERGEKLYMDTKELIQLSVQNQRERSSENTWEDKILAFFETEKQKPEDERFGKNGFKTGELFGDFGPFRSERDTESNVRRVRRALIALKFRNSQLRGICGNGRYWLPYEKRD